MHPNVKYELLELERLIGGETPESSRSLDIKGKVKVEVERIKQTLIYEVFHFEDERHLERYIQYHQQSLIRLMDRANMQLDAKQGDKEINHVFYNALDELLSFVERHFTKYFDQDAKAPEGYLALARKDSRENISKLKKVLSDLGADERLSELVLHVLRKVADSNADKGATYRKVMYAKEVVKEINRIGSKGVHASIDEDLRQLMYYLNYNSLKVVTYHAHYISSILDKAETRTEKIEKLSLMLKEVTQAQVKPGIGYNMHSASLKNQLCEYITVELEYHERLQQLIQRPPGQGSDDFLSGFKLKFEASVSQLAYLLKVLIDTKIIINNNLSQVINFIVRFVVTRRSESISYGSLRSKYYNVEAGTKESVRNMLLSMIQYIEKN
jgi:hypothetical protein